MHDGRAIAWRRPTAAANSASNARLSTVASSYQECRAAAATASTSRSVIHGPATGIVPGRGPTTASSAVSGRAIAQRELASALVGAGAVVGAELRRERGGLGLVQREVRIRAGVLVVAVGRVVVEVEHLARDARRAGVRHTLAVVRVLARREHDESVEAREGLVDRTGHLPVPELDRPAPLLFPRLREVEQRVDPAVGLELVVPVEVGVDLQEVAGPAEVDAATDEVRIGDQVVDAR